MMRNRIKSINTIDLDFESIRGEIRENLECTFADARARRQRKLPYMRAIRAVCIALCICTASVTLTFIINKTNFWNNTPIQPPSPGMIDTSDTSETNKPEETTSEPENDAAVSPDKSIYIASKFDKFFAFGYLINANIILNSSMISEPDKQTLKNYCEEWGYDSFVDGNAFGVYLGTEDGKDIIELHSWPQTNRKKLVFESNLPYSFEDIIAEFENAGKSTLSNDFLTNATEFGIDLLFKNEEGEYIPYYETCINEKVYVADIGSAGTIEQNIMSEPDIPNWTFHGHRIEKDKSITDDFDSLIAFGSSMFLKINIVRAKKLLSDEDIAILNKPTMPSEIAVYLGTKNGIDIIKIVSIYDNQIMEFKSNLDYGLMDVVSEFEKLSGERLTADYLNESNFDRYLWSNSTGIEVCLNKQTYEVYFKAKINGKMYVVDPS